MLGVGPVNQDKALWKGSDYKRVASVSDSGQCLYNVRNALVCLRLAHKEK